MRDLLTRAHTLRPAALAAVPLIFGVGVVAREAFADPPPSTASVTAVADTWVSQSPSHQNHGSEASLRVGGPGQGRSLVRFDTPSIVAALGGRALVSARLEVQLQGTSQGWGQASLGADARTVMVHRLTRSWTEAGATWDSPTQTVCSAPKRLPISEL